MYETFFLCSQWKVGVIDTKKHAKSTATEISLYSSGKCWMVKAGDHKIKVTYHDRAAITLVYAGTHICVRVCLEDD